ncbi:MAG: argininosuccinate lyase, partial [Myxococcota bacterium]
MAEDKAKLWGGGFSEGMHPALAAISESLEQDLPLADADLRGSAAYARALGRCGVLSEDESARLSDGLLELRGDLAHGRWIPTDAEDVHGAIEAEVTRRLPGLGERLHTGRSRNDQVSTAFRIAVREGVDTVIERIRRLQSALVARAKDELDTLVPSYTHIQRAQPIRLAHWILGYFWPLERDVSRLQDARKRLNVLPLGSGAVSGHPFGIDRPWLAEQLGFDGITENSLDTVGDRDFAIEFCFSSSMLAVHLSRLAEELVLWSSTEFGYVQWPDGLATGSSLMPNKKNPDLAELVRGRAAQSIGDVVSLLTLVKGLPSSYQRDLQDDKPPVWRALRTSTTSLDAMAAAMESIRFNRDR